MCDQQNIYGNDPRKGRHSIWVAVARLVIGALLINTETELIFGSCEQYRKYEKLMPATNNSRLKI
jgi:hypothetical protein